MKKNLTILGLVIIILGILTTMSYAANPDITVSGATMINPVDTETVDLSITSETAIGVIKGKIAFNDNITSITVTGAGEWTVNYNANKESAKYGEFIAYKASGGTNEKIMTIEYTTANATGEKATININNIKATNINYEVSTIENKTKEVDIVSLSVNPNAYDEEKVEGVVYLKNVNPGINITTILSNITTNALIKKAYKGVTEITNNATVLSTGMTLNFKLLKHSKTYNIVVKGDLNGDGEMDDIDLLKLARYKAEIDTNLTGAYYKATDIHYDGQYAQDSDLLKLAKILVGLDNI